MFLLIKEKLAKKILKSNHIYIINKFKRDFSYLEKPKNLSPSIQAINNIIFFDNCISKLTNLIDEF